MSILAVTAAPSTASEELSLAILFGGAVVAVAVAMMTGMLRPGAVSGRHRLMDPGRGLGALLVVMAVGFTAWFGCQVLYGTYLQVMHPALTHAAPTHAAPLASPEGKLQPISEATLRPFDWGFLSTVPYALGFVMLLAGDYLALGQGAGLERIGFRRQFGMGVLYGIVAMFIVLPLVQGVSLGAEAAYERVGFVHPQEHELLKILGESENRGVSVALVVGAVMFAPLFEELLFRGHVQTFFRELLIRRTGRRETVSTSFPEMGGDVLAYSTLPVAEKGYVWQTWGAILIASCLFTAVHPPWMWPPIFFLALCLGYAYERTGNLWTSITMHSLFNGISTFAYLMLVHR